MKNLTSLLLSLMILLTVAIIPTTAYAEKGSVSDSYTWELSDGVLTIAKGKNQSGTILGGWYENYPWYQEKDTITSIIIKEGIKNIPSSAFRYHTKVKSVTLPNSLTDIEFDAFNGCFDLTGVKIGDNVTVIGRAAFANCLNLTEVTIGKKVKTIERYAFTECKKLEKIIIPNSVTSIGENAFSACDNLRSVTLSDNISSIEPSTFSCCYSLEDINLPRGLKTIGMLAFDECNGLTDVTIPESVTNIDLRAFGHCENLKILTLLNPYCLIRDEYVTPDDTIFFGYTGSSAEDHTNTYNKKLRAIDKYVKDAAPGVVVSCAGTVLDSEVDINVDIYNSDADIEYVLTNYIISCLYIDYPDISVRTYDISATKGGKEIAPNGSVALKLPIPHGYDASLCKVFHLSSSKEVTMMDPVQVGDCMLIDTEKLGRFCIAEIINTQNDPSSITVDNHTYYRVSGTTFKNSNGDTFSVKYGDVICDGNVNMMDVTVLQRIIADLTTHESNGYGSRINSDTNHDGTVNLHDVVLIQQYIAGLTASLKH